MCPGFHQPPLLPPPLCHPTASLSSQTWDSNADIQAPAPLGPFLGLAKNPGIWAFSPTPYQAVHVQHVQRRALGVMLGKELFEPAQHAGLQGPVVRGQQEGGDGRELRGQLQQRVLEAPRLPTHIQEPQVSLGGPCPAPPDLLCPQPPHMAAEGKGWA